MNGDITLAALCHFQRASKVTSPFISFFAVFDVSIYICTCCFTTAITTVVTANKYFFTSPFVSSRFRDSGRETVGYG